MEPEYELYSNKIFGRRFGIFIKYFGEEVFARSITNKEILMCYTGSEDICCPTIDHYFLTSWLDNYLPASIPWNLRQAVTLSIIDQSNLTLYHVYSQSEHNDAVQHYTTTKRPDTLDWEQTYNEDPETKILYDI